MKNAALKPLFFANYISLIFYISFRINKEPSAISGAALLISSLLLVDITYISSLNIRENKTLHLFCGLLALDSWYLLLSLEAGTAGRFFLPLHPVIFYFSIKFVLMFLFQGSGYQFKKATDLLLFITLTGSLCANFVSVRAFACLYGIQFLAGCLCCFFLLIHHRRRAAFVLKSEWKCILFSAAATTIFFLVYYFATRKLKNHIANFGAYLPILLCSMSVHGIVIKEHGRYPLSTVFNRKQTAFILCLSLMIVGVIVALTGKSSQELFIAVNTMFALIYLCNIILDSNLRRGKGNILKESKYGDALRQLRQEELLKTEFANFLHDDVLQDLLSIKNMMTKAHRPEIQNMITKALDHLNTHIRRQMQDYHPVILEKLTIKENYRHLIESVSQSFPQRNITVSFDCPDNLFLVEPYHVLIYRLLRELLTNVFKHSDATHTAIVLALENSMISLCVSDDGTAAANSLLTADKAKHKGIAAITEQISRMEGFLTVSDNTPHGICIQIKLPMKGEDSYQYFVSG